MTPFLKELAQNIIKEYKQLDKLTIVFPNRRAALYFQHYLSVDLNRPHWAPSMYSIEEFFKLHSDLKEPDKLSLVYRLYQVYGEVLKNDEPFDRFYFWGEMLLRDFDEVDKYMVNAPQMFKDLSKVRELDEIFDFLSEEQKRFLQDFWSHFDEHPSISKDKFLKLWRRLPKVYTEFTKALKKESLGYEGMIHRDVADHFLKKPPVDCSGIIFAGFNALTRAEEIVLSSMVKAGAKIFWDADQYYVDSKLQEAGRFMRSYHSHESFANTFNELPSHFKNEKKNITVTAVPQRIGQAKLAGLEAGEVLSQLTKNDQLPFELAKTVIVLPDEGMLLPVLHSLPQELEDINVTMGFPLRDTPLFNLLDLAIEMQVKKRGSTFNHREVSALLGHAYLLALAETEAQEKRQMIIAKNRVFVTRHELTGSDAVFGLLFQPIEAVNATAYLLEIVTHLGARFTDKTNFDREFAFHFHQHLNRLHAILSNSEKPTDWRGFQKLFRQVVLMQKLPFRGEPLRGLQIMGVLETRNLDFDNVIILSMNEGHLPASARQGSYIPHSIRRAYGLPTNEHQDAIYAYLFYRLLQRAKNISFYYNTEPDIVGNGEMSRYLQQLLLESGLPVTNKVLHNAVHVHTILPVEVVKTPSVMEQLDKYVKATGSYLQRLTPSSLNDYIECGLRFYLKHIAQLKEPNEVEDEVDARVFGNIFHDMVHWFYEDLSKKRNKLILREDLEVTDEIADQLVDRGFRNLYQMNPDEPVVYEGQRVIVREVARTFFKKVIEKDKEYAPFEILMLEEPFAEEITLASGKKVRIGGKIDRADRKDGVIRVIDYKTGKDDHEFESIDSLFSRDGKRNKAAFQTILYAFVYSLRNLKQGEKVKPGLINRKSLTEKSFGHQMDKKNLEDVLPYLPQFGSSLSQLVEELYDANTPFKQTQYTASCQYCTYKSLCRR